MIRFTKEYSKLNFPVFTTIRRNTKHYSVGRWHLIVTPKQRFRAQIIMMFPMKKEDITVQTAMEDAECSREELIDKLEKWHGKKYDDFVLLVIGKSIEKEKEK